MSTTTKSRRCTSSWQRLYCEADVDRTRRYRCHDASATCTRWQHEVYALTRSGFDYYRSQANGSPVFRVVALLNRLLLGCVLGAGVLCVVRCCALVAALLFTWVFGNRVPVACISDGALYLVAAAALVLAYVPFRMTFGHRPIGRIRDRQTDGDRLVLGRLDDILDNRRLLQIAGLLGLLLGLHSGLIYLASDHMGCRGDISLADSVILVLDTLLNGTLHKLSQCMGIGWPEPLQLQLLSTALTWLFRVAAYGLVGLALLVCWRRRRLLQIFDGYPPDRRQYHAFCEWLRSICHERRFGLHRYPDEHAFLCVTREFLRGDYAKAQTIDETIKLRRVAPSVRRLFRKPD